MHSSQPGTPPGPSGQRDRAGAPGRPGASARRVSWRRSTGKLTLAAGAVLAAAGVTTAGVLATPPGRPPRAALAALSRPSASAPSPVPAVSAPSTTAPSPVPAVSAPSTATPSPVPSVSALSPVPSVSAPSPVPSVSAPGPGPSQAPTPVPMPSGAVPAVPEGRVIHTGIRDAAGELVLYGIRIHLHVLPGTQFGIMAAARNGAGVLAPLVETNETAGPDRAPGFHAVEAPLTAGPPGVAVPEFGYYAGPAVKITGMAGGREVQARTARWSADPGIVIFWFAPARAPGRSAAIVTGLTAYDAAGQPLPAGHGSPGVG